MTIAPDGLFILEHGIHPIYLDMTFQDFILALGKWEVLEIGNDGDYLSIILSKNGINVEVSFFKPDVGQPTFEHLISISSEQCMLPNGCFAASGSIKELQKSLGMIFKQKESLNLDGSIINYYGDDNCTITEDDDVISDIILLRNPINNTQ